MSDKEQKLVGYIVYDIWTYMARSSQDENYKHQVILPEVHWKKKIYVTLSSAEEAARHLESKNRLTKAIIVPIYANREDLNKVKEGHQELKERVEQINKEIDE
jgi:hypothetical protein